MALVGVAVKVALVPAHNGLLPVVCAIVILGVVLVVILTVIPLEVEVEGEAHNSLEVNTQDTI